MAPRAYKAHFVGYYYMSTLTDVTAKYAAEKISSSNTPSTSVVPAPQTCLLMMLLTSPAVSLWQVTTLRHCLEFALLATNVGTVFISQTCVLLQTHLHPCSESHPILSSLSPRYTASTQHDRVPPRLQGYLGTPDGSPPVDHDKIAYYWFNTLASESVELSRQATKDPDWAAAIDKEHTKFDV